MHVLLVLVGSLGDTLPALAWAKNLTEDAGTK